MIQNNWNQFKSINDQSRVLNSFFEMVNLKVVDTNADNNKLFIQNLLLLTD